MTIQEWLNQSFVSDNMDDVIVADNISVNPDTFAQMSNTITSIPPTYAELSTLSIAKAGWQSIFDQWKSKGIVS